MIGFKYFPNYFLSDKTCQYFAPNQDQCFLHESPLFGNLMNMLTAALILVGILFEIGLLFVIGDLPLYGDDEQDDVYR